LSSNYTSPNLGSAHNSKGPQSVVNLLQGQIFLLLRISFSGELPGVSVDLQIWHILHTCFPAEKLLFIARALNQSGSLVERASSSSSVLHSSIVQAPPPLFQLHEGNNEGLALEQ